LSSLYKHGLPNALSTYNNIYLALPDFSVKALHTTMQNQSHEINKIHAEG